MKRTLIVIAVLVSGIAVFVDAQSWMPDDAQIAKLESSVKLEQLPYWKAQHLPALNRYSRYYLGSSVNGERVILAEFVLGFDAKQGPGTHVVAGKRDFPVIMDGGCSVINAVYSLREEKIISMQCNGRA